jgi:alpha-tubulin suppressor-like RCC1 family protein
LGADAGGNTASFPKDEGEKYTFRVFSMDVTGKVVPSDCSAPVTYQDSFAVATSAIGGKINEANVASVPFYGRCAQGSTVQVSAPSATNFTSFTCSSAGTWSRALDLSAVAGVYSGDITFSVTPSGGGTPKSYTVTVDKDSVPPSIDIPSATTINAANQSAYTISGTCSENSQDVTIAIGTINTTATCSSGTFSKTLDVSSLTGNTISLSATHKDTYDNTRSKFVITSRYATVPTITSVALNAGAATTNSLSVTLNMNVTGATQMYVTNTAGCGSGGSWETYSTSKAWTLPSANTTNTVYVKFKESHDNETACVNDDILHDNINPTVTITSPIAGSYVNSSNVTAFTINGACSENGRSITITGPSSFTATTTCSGTAFSAILDLSTLAQGSFQLSAAINDIAGNSGSGTSPSYTKDTGLPTGTITINNGDVATTSLSANLTLTSSDGGGQMYVTNTSGCASGGAWESFATSKSWTLPTANATNTVYVKFKDVAGNESTCYSDSIDHTSSLPTVTISSPASGTYINLGNATAFTISGACSENGKAVNVTVTGLSTQTATCSSGSWSKSIDVSSLGDASISFTANHSRTTGIDATPASQSYTKDTVAPTIQTFVIKNDDLYTGNLTNLVTIAATGASDMYITNNALCLTGGTWETYATAQIWTLTTSDALNTVYFKTRDVAGNESNCVSDTITHDGSNPVLTWSSPANLSYINSSNASSFTVSGVCNLNGRTVDFMVYLGATDQGISGSTTCTSNAWSANLNLAGLADTSGTPFSVFARLTALNGNTSSPTRNFYKDTVAPGAATLSGAPTGTNTTSTLNITVAGTGITQYRYFVVPPSGSEVCTNMAAYTGSAIAVATKITDTLTEQGAYKVCVQGRETSGNYSTTSVSASWTRDTVGPVPSLVSSTTADGTYGTGSTINVRVTFNENVTVSGSPYIVMASGSTTRNATYSSGSGTTTLNFTYTVVTGDSASDLDYTSAATIVLNGGTLRDALSNNATLTLPAAGSANSLAGQKDIVINAPLPTATLSGTPASVSSNTYLNVTVGGTNVTKYKYAVITSGTCAAASYSSAIATATPIGTYIYSYSNSYVTLCVLGGDVSNNFQLASAATSYTWYQDGMQTVTITTPAMNRVNEGTLNQKVTVGIPAAKPYDFTVSYAVTGDAVAGVNHDLASGTVTFTAGTTAVDIPVNFADNATADGERVLNVHLTSASHSMVMLGTNYQAQYYISDDEKNLTTTQVALGRTHSCALMSDSSVRCWGHNTYGGLGDGTTKFKDTAVTVSSGTSFKSVSVGQDHSCAVTTAGALYCWGLNTSNQVGDNTTTQRTSPTAIDVGVNYLMVSSGEAHSCGITTANKLRCWGLGDYGQIGNAGTANQAVPVNIDNTVDYKFVALGSKSTCAITTSNKLRCWGRNVYYTLGDGTTTWKSSPQDIDATADYDSVSMGSHHACGILTSGGMRCWGDNTYGQIGDGSNTTRTTPVDVNSGTTYTSVSVNDETVNASGRGFTCAVTASNILQCWGNNTVYQLADGTATNRNAPVVADNGTSYSKVFASGVRACGITTSGALKCWGNLTSDSTRNMYLYGAGLGNVYATYAAFTQQYKDWSFSNLSFASNGFENGTQNCGIQAGKLYCWGSQTIFGDKTYTDTRRPGPVLLDPTTDYSKVATRHDSNDNCAITTTGDLKCWGVNNYGEFSNGVAMSATLSVPTSVDPGVQYSEVSIMSHALCGITTAGELRCAGTNGYGQLGNGTTSAIVGMTTIDAGTTYKYVERGMYTTCGLTTANTIKCWGHNASGSIGNGTTTNSSLPVEIDSGVTYKKISFMGTGCGITSTDTLRCWGSNFYRLVGNNSSSDALSPVTIDGGATYKDISLSDANTCGVKVDGTLRCWGDPAVWGVTSPYETGGSTLFAIPFTADSGVTYTSVEVGPYIICGTTSGGIMKCSGRAVGKSLGNVDAGQSAAAVSLSLPLTNAPVYLQKWLNY